MQFSPLHYGYSDSDDEDMFFYDAQSDMTDIEHGNVSNNEVFHDALEKLPCTRDSSNTSPLSLSSLLFWIPLINPTLLLLWNLLSLLSSQVLFRGYTSFENWWSSLLECFSGDNVVRTPNPFAYPKCYMVLSCVMLSMSFVKFLGWNDSSILWPFSLLYRRPVKPKIVKPQPKVVAKIKPTKSPSKCMSRLALLSAMGRVYDLPMVSSSPLRHYRPQLLKLAAKQGFIQPSLLQDPLIIQAIREQCCAIDEVQLEGSFQFVVDSGCTTSVTSHREDFEHLEYLPIPITLHGVAGDSKVVEGGTMKFECIDTKGHVVTIRTFGYYNPDINVRLFSPQGFFSGLADHNCSFTVSWAKTFLQLGVHTLPCHIDQQSLMPLLTCFHDADATARSLNLHPSCVTDSSNDNLTAVQRHLLRFHYKLGHLGFQHLKWFLSGGILGPLGIRCSKSDVMSPLCQACLHGGQQRKPVAGKKHTQEPRGKLTQEKLTPGQKVFSDQYVSSVAGRNFTGRGHSQTNIHYKGGTVFVDAASSFMSLHHQVGFTAMETISSKLAFEREASTVGNTIQSYTTDNGVYTAKDFTVELEKQGQSLQLSGVGAHHQNGPAENAIKNISRKARIFMLHAALRWPEHYDKSLWPLAMTHAVHMHNHTPRRTDGLCPVEIWSRSKSNHSHLKNAHPWGCPVYVLDPRLQDGFKLPKWEPRSRRGIYMGISPLHASSVGLILNPNTNRISPQFHCIYDDYFETVHSNDATSIPPAWEELVINNRFRNDVEDEDVEDTWEQPLSTPSPDSETTTAPPVTDHHGNDIAADTGIDPALLPPRLDEARLPTPQQRESANDAPVALEPADAPPRSSEQPRRSTRVRKPVDRFKFDKTHGYGLVKKFSLSLCKCLLNFTHLQRIYDVNYYFALVLDSEFGILDNVMSLPPDILIRNPFMFKAKSKSDPDTPNIREAMTGPYREEFLEGMLNEITELISHDTWEVIERSKIPKIKDENGKEYTPDVIPTTWAFKIKRWPHGLLRKIKARFCVRGDLQEGVDDVFDTYAPVASWTSIRMLTILAIQHQWVTKQIDFSNAFVQAPLEKPVYVSLPAMFNDSSGLDPRQLCLRLKKSLYGMREAPKLWNDWLSKALVRAGFVSSTEDPGIFYGRGMAIAVYVDDVLFFGPSEAEMEKVISELQEGGFELKREKGGDDSAYSFLGINIEEDHGMIKMTQHGLIKKFLKTVEMTDCNPSKTPATQVPLGTNANGPYHKEKWEYASAVGMLMYLAGNAHPEICFAVHQCARFTHSPRQTHAEAVKRIARYLKGILMNNQGLMFRPTNNLSLDCWVDADFAGLWGYEDDQDPICVRSRTGYVMCLGDCPIHWTSKLQTETALSTTEAEYIALAQAFRELIPMRRMFEEVLKALSLEQTCPVTVKSKIFEDNNGAISTATTPKMTPRTKHIAVKYHFVKDYFARRKMGDHPFELLKIDTLDQKADIFTKGLNEVAFSRIRKLLCHY